MPEEKSLPKPLTDLPKPEKDLPLPEKEIPAHASEPNTNTELEKNHRGSTILKSFLLGIFFVILIVVIGGGSFLLGKNTKSENKQMTTTQVSSPSPTPSWKAYIGESFNFKYPTSLFLFDCSENIQTPKGIYIHLVEDKKIDCNQPLTSSQNLIKISTFNDFNEMRNIGRLNERDEEIVKIDGKEYTLITGSYEISGSEGEQISSNPVMSVSYVLVPFKNDKFLIEYMRVSQVSNNDTFYSVQKDLSETFSQILSSFKFVDLSPIIDNPEIKVAAEKELGNGYEQVRITKMYGENYALGSAGFKTGGGLSFVMHKENGIWKIITKGTESPGCSTVTQYPDFPKEICSPEY